MLNALKRFALKWFSPYTIMYVNPYFGDVVYEVHHSWTFEDALEWAACSLREEEVVIYKYHNLVARRLETLEC
jgi:hypothetical protein